MKTKQQTKKRKKYIITVRMLDEQYKDYKNEKFIFRSAKQRAPLVELCKQKKVMFALTEQ